MLVTFLGQACKASGDINSKITDGKEHHFEPLWRGGYKAGSPAGSPTFVCPFLAHSEKRNQKRGATPKAPKFLFIFFGAKKKNQRRLLPPRPPA